MLSTSQRNIDIDRVSVAYATKDDEKTPASYTLGCHYASYYPLEWTNSSSQRSLDDKKQLPKPIAIPLSLQDRISKTKICIHNLSGKCHRAAKCSFAHSPDELRQPPNLYKTRLCINFMSPAGCIKGNDCKFAHGQQELRTTHEVYKTSLCPYWTYSNGTTQSCFLSDRCRWSHELNDLHICNSLNDQMAQTSNVEKHCPGNNIILNDDNLFSAEANNDFANKYINVKNEVSLTAESLRSVSASYIKQFSITDDATDEYRSGEEEEEEEEEEDDNSLYLPQLSCPDLMVYASAPESVESIEPKKSLMGGTGNSQGTGNNVLTSRYYVEYQVIS